MPKKSDKKKKVIKKKVVKKTSPKPTFIYAERLPTKKCCTEINKTGEGYTIPFGYRDLKGTQAIQTIAPIQSFIQKKSVETQSEFPKESEANIAGKQRLPTASGIAPSPKVVTSKPRRTKQEMSEARQMEREDISSINLGLGRYNFEPTETESITSEITQPIFGGIKPIRKNSIEDLQRRYYDQTGEYFQMPKNYKVKDFKALVEKMEQL